MKGHIRQRSPGSFELKYEVERDASGKRQVAYRSFKGTKRAAQTELARLVTAVDAGAHVAKAKISVGAYVAERIEQWEALGRITAKTAERYRELLQNQITPFIGQLALQALKAADIEKWHATLRVSGRKDGQGGLSAVTVRHAHRLLSKALREAQRFDLTARNAASLISAPQAPHREVEILTADQVRAVVTGLKGRAIYPKAILALFCGLRRGEILALRWRDLVGKSLAVRESIEETQEGGLVFKAPKSRAGVREIPLPDVVVGALDDYRRQQLEQRLALGLGRPTGDVLVFSRPDGGPQSPHTLTSDWRKAAASLGLGDVTFHALRHTCASMLIDAGVDIVRVSKRLGHATPVVTLGVYSHLFSQRDDKSAQAVNDAVASILGA
jgi:integrase